MERDRIGQDSGRRGAGGARRRRARASRTRASQRSVARNRILALAILAILGLAAVAPAGQASDSSRGAERAGQKAVRDAERAAERETRRLQRRNDRLTESARKRAAREAAKHAAERSVTTATNHAVVTIECNRIVVEYKEFPEEGTNTTAEKISFKQAKPGPAWTSPINLYSFTGAQSSREIAIAAPLGQSTVLFRSRFTNNGMRGTAAAHARLYCGALPGYSLSTEQSISGPYTTSTLPGEAGQTVSYKTVAANTGNTPLTFSNFSAPGCDRAPAGGSKTAILPHESTLFNCSHTLSDADATAGLFANAASVTGTPAAGDGAPITLVSGGVLVSPVKPGPAKGEVTTPSTPVGPAPSSAVPTKSGQLAFSSARIPSLLGPAKCIRGAFTVSVKSAGVASVVFYIDGHRLTRRTVHSAQKGLISLRINGAKLKPGIHHLTATITMVPGSPAAKAVVALRARVVRRCSVAKATH